MFSVLRDANTKGDNFESLDWSHELSLPHAIGVIVSCPMVSYISLAQGHLRSNCSFDVLAELRAGTNIKLKAPF